MEILEIFESILKNGGFYFYFFIRGLEELSFLDKFLFSMELSIRVEMVKGSYFVGGFIGSLVKF